MAKSSPAGGSGGDTKSPAPAIAEALRTVRVPATDDAREEADAVRNAQQEADTEARASSVDVVSGLVRDDAAGDPSTDPGTDGGLDTTGGALRGRLGTTDEFERLASVLDSPTDAPDDASRAERGSSMFEAGSGGSDPLPLEELTQEGRTAPTSPIVEQTGTGEVDKVVAGDKTQTRDGIGNIPFFGEKVDDALNSAAVSSGRHAGELNQAANSDPTTNTGTSTSTGSGGTTGSGATNGGSTGSDGNTGNTGNTGDSGDGGGNLVTDEYDNDDGSHVTAYSNGDIITTYADGTVETNYADGTVETDYPDGTLKTEYPDGSTETIHPDGTIEETDPTPAPTDSDDSGSGDSGSGDSGSGDSGSGDSGSGDSGSGDAGSGGAPSAQMGTEGGGGGDPGGPEEGANLPPEIRNQLAADFAAQRAQLHPVDPGDGVSDPNPDADPGFGSGAAAGPVPDGHAVLGNALTQPIRGDGPEFGHGALPDDVGPPSGSDPRVTDPSPDADTGVQLTGPEERDTTHDIAGTVAPPTDTTTDTTTDSTEDDGSDSGSFAHLSPLRSVIDTPTFAGHLVASRDDADDDPDD